MGFFTVNSVGSAACTSSDIFLVSSCLWSCLECSFSSFWSSPTTKFLLFISVKPYPPLSVLQWCSASLEVRSALSLQQDLWLFSAEKKTIFRAQAWLCEAKARVLLNSVSHWRTWYCTEQLQCWNLCPICVCLTSLLDCFRRNAQWRASQKKKSGKFEWLIFLKSRKKLDPRWSWLGEKPNGN